MDEQRDLNEFLSRIYEILKQHEEKLNCHIQRQMALVAALTELLPGFSTVFGKHFDEAGKELQERGSDDQIHLFDELIRRLRRKD